MLGTVYRPLKEVITFEGHSAQVVVPIPEGYPMTPLRQYLDRESRPLFQGDFSYLSRGMMVDPDDADRFREETGIELASPTLYIDYLISGARLANVTLTPEERKLTGLGRRVICRVIPIIAKRWGLTESNPVTLLVSGTRMKLPPTNLSNGQLISDIIELLGLSRSDPDYLDQVVELAELSRAGLRQTLSELLSNKRLRDYYARAFGMRPVEKKGAIVYMATSLGSLMNQCLTGD